jgi:hypothetical protein
MIWGYVVQEPLLWERRHRYDCPSSDRRGLYEKPPFAGGRKSDPRFPPCFCRRRKPLGILLTNRQIYDEASSMFLSNTTICLTSCDLPNVSGLGLRPSFVARIRHVSVMCFQDACNCWHQNNSASKLKSFWKGISPFSGLEILEVRIECIEYYHRPGFALDHPNVRLPNLRQFRAISCSKKGRLLESFDVYMVVCVNIDPTSVVNRDDVQTYYTNFQNYGRRIRRRLVELDQMEHGSQDPLSDQMAIVEHPEDTKILILGLGNNKSWRRKFELLRLRDRVSQRESRIEQDRQDRLAVKREERRETNDRFARLCKESKEAKVQLRKEEKKEEVRAEARNARNQRAKLRRKVSAATKTRHGERKRVGRV